MHNQITISAPTKEEAQKIGDELLNQKLIAGCMLTSGDARYWWDGEVVERIYWNINAFTVSEHKEKIISIVKKISSDETPIIAFVQMDGSPDFLKWVSENTLGDTK